MDDYLYTKISVWDSHENWFKDELSKYKIPRWHNQEFKVIIVLEKDALMTVFSQICNPLELTLVVNRGYNSFTQLKEIANKLEEIDSNLVFLTFGDFDPTGKDIMRNFKDQLTQLGIEGEYVEIALNENQISEYNIPPAPTKKSDFRAKKFIEKFGDKTVELDGLEPSILQDLIRESVEQYFDEKIFDNNKPIQEGYTKYLDKRLENVQWS